MSAKSTWVSGGSGCGVYDPVTTGDNLGVHYTDQDEGWLRFKGRKYNFGTYRNTGLKGLCDDIRSRSRPKCLLIGFIATVMIILLIAVIAIASSRDSNNLGYEKWENKTVGLNFRPMGQQGTVFLPFSVHQGRDDTFSDYAQQMEDAVGSYKTVHIFNEGHVACNETYAPADKICQQPISVFGVNCVHFRHYGYKEGTPCVLLTLSLPKDYTVRALLPKDEAYVDAENALGNRYSPNYVGVSCEPATAEDRRYMGNTSAFGAAIDYNPPHGFPTYFFRPRSQETFIPPAVMVQFLSIRDSVKEAHMVRIKCTAWGKAMDRQGTVVDYGSLFTTSFVFRIY